MAFEHCSSSVNPVVTELVKNVVTPRCTGRPSGQQMLVRTPSESRDPQSHRQSGLTLPLCFSCFCQKMQMILIEYKCFSACS